MGCIGYQGRHEINRYPINAGLWNWYWGLLVTRVMFIVLFIFKMYSLCMGYACDYLSDHNYKHSVTCLLHELRYLFVDIPNTSTTYANPWCLFLIYLSCRPTDASSLGTAFFIIIIVIFIVIIVVVVVVIIIIIFIVIPIPLYCLI